MQNGSYCACGAPAFFILHSQFCIWKRVIQTSCVALARLRFTTTHLVIMHSTLSTHHFPTVHLFASAKSWIEGEAVRQLYATSKLEGMRLVVGFPDLHPGKCSPVGAAFVTEGLIYPHLIGGDIGCGMALF